LHNGNKGKKNKKALEFQALKYGFSYEKKGFRFAEMMIFLEKMSEKDEC
jgi:hypothetical protein